MAIFAFAVTGKYPCVLWIRIYPSFQIANEATVGQTTDVALANDSLFNFYFVISFIE